MSSYKELDKKDRIDFYIALAVILSVLCFVLYYSFSDLFSDKEVSFLQAEIDEIRLDDTLVVDGATYVPFVHNAETDQISPEVIEEVDAEILVDSSSLISSPFKDIDKSTLDASEVEKETENIIQEVPAKINAVVNEVVDRETKIDSNATLVQKDEAELIDTSMNDVPEVEVAPIVTNTSDKSCVIAIGIYRNERNANKMLNRLKKAGYDAFSVSRRNKVRVQVYHPCDTNSLNESLSNIRANFASDALVLIKE